MTNYSYNDLKNHLKDEWGDWISNEPLPFQPPLNNNSANADSKIYTESEYRKIKNFFLDQRPFNPFCKRVNCWNINLDHSHASPENKRDYLKRLVRLLKIWRDKASSDNDLNQTELSQLDKVIKLWEKKSSFEFQEKALRKHWNQTAFNTWSGSNVCLDIVDKLKKEIENGKIIDEIEQSGPEDESDNDKDLEAMQAKLLEWFKSRGIKSITLQNNKLLIEFNFREEIKEEPILTEMQQLFQDYCQAKGVEILNLSDLEKSNRRQESGNDKFLFYIGIAAAAILIVGLIAYFAYRSEKSRPRRYY